mmetsp:Transcript_41892/g.103282  ORF Transcript_41892/g.103282 Transcript_41892/m.103282 type:complete len:207 (-) Transcript_41892:2590-3210(-)
MATRSATRAKLRLSLRLRAPNLRTGTIRRRTTRSGEALATATVNTWRGTPSSPGTRATTRATTRVLTKPTTSGSTGGRRRTRPSPQLSPCATDAQARTTRAMSSSRPRRSCRRWRPRAAGRQSYSPTGSASSKGRHRLRMRSSTLCGRKSAMARKLREVLATCTSARWRRTRQLRRKQHWRLQSNTGEVWSAWLSLSPARTRPIPP